MYMKVKSIDAPHIIYFVLKLISVEINEKFIIFIKPSIKVSAN